MCSMDLLIQAFANNMPTVFGDWLQLLASVTGSAIRKELPSPSFD